jgi:hypothetical protein
MAASVVPFVQAPWNLRTYRSDESDVVIFHRDVIAKQPERVCDVTLGYFYPHLSTPDSEQDKAFNPDSSELKRFLMELYELGRSLPPGDVSISC